MSRASRLTPNTRGFLLLWTRHLFPGPEEVSQDPGANKAPSQALPACLPPDRRNSQPACPGAPSETPDPDGPRRSIELIQTCEQRDVWKLLKKPFN